MNPDAPINPKLEGLPLMQVAEAMAQKDRRIAKLEARLEAVTGLLRTAKCPETYCDGKGTCAVENICGYNEYGEAIVDAEAWQCQWCDERDKALDPPQQEEK